MGSARMSGRGDSARLSARADSALSGRGGTGGDSARLSGRCSARRKKHVDRRGLAGAGAEMLNPSVTLDASKKRLLDFSNSNNGSQE